MPASSRSGWRCAQHLQPGGALCGHRSSSPRQAKRITPLDLPHMFTLVQLIAVGLFGLLHLDEAMATYDANVIVITTKKCPL
jgi:hypothetical protein